MPIKEFWEEEPNLFWAYRFSFYQVKKQEHELLNQQAWLQGAYIYEAVSCAINNNFNKQKMDYRDKPYGYEDDNKKEQVDKRKLLEEQLKSRAKKIEGLLGGKKDE